MNELETSTPDRDMVCLVSGDIRKNNVLLGEFTTIADWNQKERRFKGNQILDDYIVKEWREFSTCVRSSENINHKNR